jgi:hypothetical protein
MSDATELERLAEADGATFSQSDDGEWSVKDKHGLLIADGALSQAEAARLYCEDKGLPSAQEILDRIVARYRPYHVLEEFWQGFGASRRNSVLRRNPHRNGVKADAWERGSAVAMQYQRALALRAGSSGRGGADMARITNDEILSRIWREFRPDNTLPAFKEGYRACRRDGASRRNPYGETETHHGQVNAQAWERGANAALLYQRALAHLEAKPADATAANGHRWLNRLIRHGRR